MELRRNRIDRKAEENKCTREKKKQTKHGKNKSAIKLRNKMQIKQNSKTKYGETKRIKIGIDGKSSETNSTHQKTKYK
jgi:hypothetical protein